MLYYNFNNYEEFKIKGALADYAAKRTELEKVYVRNLCEMYD